MSERSALIIIGPEELPVTPTGRLLLSDINQDGQQSI